MRTIKERRVIESSVSSLEAQTKELQQLYSEVEAELKQSTLANSPLSTLNTVLFAAALTGLGGLLVGIAIGTTFIAPTL